MKTLYQKIESTAGYLNRIDEGTEIPHHYRLRLQGTNQAPEMIYGIFQKSIDAISVMELPLQQKQIIDAFLVGLRKKIEKLKTLIPAAEISEKNIDNRLGLPAVLSNFHDDILFDVFRMIPRNRKISNAIDDIARLVVLTKYKIDSNISRQNKHV